MIMTIRELIKPAAFRAFGTREGWANSTDARNFWRVTYRDWRKYAQIASHALTELVELRGFGVLKQAHATDLITHVGRVRVNNYRNYDYKAVADSLAMSPKDYNPSRRLALEIN